MIAVMPKLPPIYLSISLSLLQLIRIHQHRASKCKSVYWPNQTIASSTQGTPPPPLQIQIMLGLSSLISSCKDQRIPVGLIF